MATKTQTPAPALSPARVLLQQAIEAQGRAKVLEDKAQKVVEAASAALEEARAEAVKYDEAHEDLVQSRLAELKGESPAKSAQEIRESRRARLIAKEELQASDEVLSVAKQELEQAEGNIARTAKVAASHATACLGEAATSVIEQWNTVNQERERLRVILDSLVVARVALDTHHVIQGTSQIIPSTLKAEQQHQVLHDAVVGSKLPWGDYQDWKHLQNKINAALSHDYSQRDPGPGISRGRAFWASFADALLQDPAAEQAPLPSADTLFS